MSWGIGWHMYYLLNMYLRLFSSHFMVLVPTAMNFNSLNLIGWFIEIRWTVIITFASGPLASFIMSLISLSHSYLRKDANSDFRAILAIVGFASLFDEIFYALNNLDIITWRLQLP